MKVFFTYLLTISGFAAAFLANIFVRQTAAVEIKAYNFGGTVLNINDGYRIVLAAVMLIYGATLLRALFQKGDADTRERRLKNFAKRVPFRIAAGIALAVWDILGTKMLMLPQPFFPGPAKIVEAFLSEGDFVLQNTLYSLRLFAVGFSVGVIFGVGTGVVIGWFPKARYWVEPVLKMTGVIPAVAWMPFALTLFPSPFSAAVFLIVICAWFSIASLTAQGIQSVPREQFEAARVLGAGAVRMVFRVAVPHAMPQIFTGITTACGFAFTTLVMAEMMGQPGGLGYYINTSKVWSAYYKVFAAIIVMAVLFSIITAVLGVIRSRALRWREGLTL